MANERRPLIIDHDAGVDDLAAIAIAHLSEKFRIDAITICPADSLKTPAIQITMGLVKFLAMNKVVVAASDNEGVNLFPEKWRKDSERMAQIDELKISSIDYSKWGFTTAPAAEKLAEILSGKTKYEILATGPLSNVADALRLKPAIAKNIKQIYFMGGALHVSGNVEQPGHDVSAEWNVYNYPQAVADVLAAGVPIVFVALDATNKVPVTREFMRSLQKQSEYKVSKLFHQVWSVIAAQIESENYQQTYFFWDTLTAAYAANSKIGKLRKEKVRVVTDGSSEGRTVADAKGVAAQALTNPDAKLLHQFILDLMKK